MPWVLKRQWNLDDRKSYWKWADIVKFLLNLVRCILRPINELLYEHKNYEEISHVWEKGEILM